MEVQRWMLVTFGDNIASEIMTTVVSSDHTGFHMLRLS
jgi:hypothetical protein